MFFLTSACTSPGSFVLSRPWLCRTVDVIILPPPYSYFFIPPPDLELRSLLACDVLAVFFEPSIAGPLSVGDAHVLEGDLLLETTLC